MIRNCLRALTLSLAIGRTVETLADEIPKPEHPTPDAVRPHWLNLNGPWQFRFDPGDVGVKQRWFESDAEGFDRTIIVPFGWESPLSVIEDTKYKGVGWYRRTVQIPEDFPGSDHVWLHFDAVDYRADVWVNGRYLATHEGGYTPFSVDITEVIGRAGPDRPGGNGGQAKALIVVRAFDKTDPGLPTGKQVGWYTPTSGIWQTVWLESRPKVHIGQFTVKTTTDPATAVFEIEVANYDNNWYAISIKSDDPSVGPASFNLTPKGFAGVAEPESAGRRLSRDRIELPVKIRDPKLWTPDSPHLYNVTLRVEEAVDGVPKHPDSVQSYFGLRTIARGKYGDEPYERLLLNDKPVYLRAALDQSFNPKGIYTAPDDAFLRRDIELAKEAGLNGLRIHIKPDEPRRLYWADRLGLLILEDMPNTWRQSPTARRAWESTMREVVARDRNHPSIIAWVAFNETWGLGTPRDYKADRDTQAWVGNMVDAIRKLDPTRLVEDNSPCNYDHVENTDLNSWHFYIDNPAAAREHVEQVVAKVEPGSGFNYCPGLKQSTAPLINSEYGSVGAGSGDRDVSWGFRDLTTLLRRQPKIQGYVYTELSDIEWEHNGFYNYDRSPKAFGYDAFVKGMTVADLQGADFIGYDAPPVLVARPGEEISVPVFVSHFSDRTEPPMLRWTLRMFNHFGAIQEVASQAAPFQPIEWTSCGVRALDPIKLRVPGEPTVGALGLVLVDRQGNRVAANFVNVVVETEDPQPRIERISDSKTLLKVRFSPNDFARRSWSGPVAIVPGKVSGQGSGGFEYRLKLPESIVKARPESLALWVEAASRAGRGKVDWADRTNPQDYPQTDVRKWPTTLRLTVNGHELGRASLPDDPADARGVRSHLRRVDPGSHGELVALGGTLPEPLRADLAEGTPLVIRLSVPDDTLRAGGLSLYGAGMGAYSFDPTLMIRTRQPLPTELGVQTDAPLTIETLSARQSVIVASGDSGRKPTSWAYTTTDPGPRWAEPDFDDSAWKRGPAGFGSPGTPAVRVETPWETETIWLRGSVDLPALKPDDSLALHLFHDEDVAILVNGRSLVRERGYLTTYRDLSLTDAQRALFRPGVNTIAVSCRQTSGGQGIDLGLTLLRSE
jgi:hypothetical protein